MVIRAEAAGAHNEPNSGRGGRTLPPHARALTTAADKVPADKITMADKTTADKTKTAAPAAAASTSDTWTTVQAKRRVQRVSSRALSQDHRGQDHQSRGRAPSPASSDTSSRASSRSVVSSASAVSGATATSRASTARATAERRDGRRDRRERLPPVSTLTVGATVTGVVTGVHSWGAFVSCGVSSDGLLHACEADADGRFVQDVTALLRTGEALALTVLTVDVEAGRFTLTRCADRCSERRAERAASIKSLARTTKRPPQSTTTPATTPATTTTTPPSAAELATLLACMRDRDGALAFARECLVAARREVEPSHARVCEAFLAKFDLPPKSGQCEILEEVFEEGIEVLREVVEEVSPSAAAVLRGDASAPAPATPPSSLEVVATSTVRGKVLKLYKMPWATWTTPFKGEITT